MNHRRATLLAIALLFAWHAPAQISIGPTGSGLRTFNTLPTVAEGWSTMSVGSIASTYNSAVNLDNHVSNTVTATNLNGALTGSATVNPPAVTSIARWNSVNFNLQTRPTGNDYLLLLARLRNNTGSNVVALTVSYAYGVDPAATPAEQIVGHRVFYSLTGMPGTWRLLPSLSGVAASGDLTAPIALNWANGGDFYLLWADDNADGTEGAYTIDNFQVTAVPATIPSFITQPQSQSVAPGGVVPFFAEVVGAFPLACQWRKDNNDISGATNLTFILAGAQLSDAANYSLTVSNIFGVAVSSNATLAVGCFEPVNITSPPQGKTLITGSTLNLSVGVGGTVPFTYQWLRNGLPLSGATNATYVRTNVLTSDSGLYVVTVSNCAGTITSAPVVVSVSDAPFVLLGLTNHFWKFDQSTADLGTAWRAPEYDDSTWPQGRGVLAREDQSILVPLTNTVLSLTNSSGTPIIGYYFRTQFLFTNDPGLITLLSSNYIDDGAVIYLNGVEAMRFNMPGAMTMISRETLAPAANPLNEGVPIVSNLPPHLLVQGTNTIAVEVHQNSGTSSDVVFGADVRVVFLPPTLVQITNQPADQTVFEGATVMLSAGVGGVAAHYQWFKDGTAILGANASVLVLPAVGDADAAGYFLVASNAINSATTRVAQVTVELDQTPPMLLAADWLDTTHLLASFSEALQPGSATNLEHYSITNTLGGTLTLFTVVLTNGTNVLLATAASSPSLNYVLTVAGIPDTSQSQNLLALSAVPVARWITLVTYDALWDYFDPFPPFDEPDPGPGWRELDYDLSAWGQGAGAFRFSLDESLGMSAPVNTALNQTPTHSTFFRRTFTTPTVSPGELRLRLRSEINDAAVFYLNGVELLRTNLPNGAITPATPAAVSAGSILVPNVREFSPPPLHPGTNLLAVELHQYVEADAQKYFAAELLARIESFLFGPLLVLRGPLDATVPENQPAIFRVSSVAAGAFQWQVNGGNVFGATNSTFTFPASLFLDGAQIRCAISQSGTTLLTTNATLHVIPDMARPQLFAAQASDNGTITLAFNEVLDPASATNAANYTVTNGLGQTLALSGISLIDGSNVVLHVSGLFPGHHGVIVSNVRDASVAGNIVWPGTSVLAGYTGQVIAIDSFWRYDAAGVNRGDANVWTAPDYDHGAWTGTGQGLFVADSGGFAPYPAPVLTSPPLTGTVSGTSLANWYFRTAFVTTSGGAGTLKLRPVLDDGAVFYLNGREIYRLGVAANINPTFGTLANRTVGDAIYEGPFTVLVTNLAAGTNVLSALACQTTVTSQDFAFGLEARLELAGQLLPVNEAAPALRFAESAGQIVFSWDGGGVLESAPTPAGPWNAVTGNSPHFVLPTNSAGFFRVRR
jgi:hypothetical protein